MMFNATLYNILVISWLSNVYVINWSEVRGFAQFYLMLYIGDLICNIL
jgi:hypothetical protein